jgi:cellulose synthase/poly-beta-1,6-N-acetylglucosamine synthase-like glycosyltransferase
VTFEALLRTSVLACTLYLLVVYGMYVWLMLVGFVETRRRLRERAGEDLDMLASTRFAPGVSIIVPAYNESIGMPDAVRSLLTIDYPDFEVIVVNDASPDRLVERVRPFLSDPRVIGLLNSYFVPAYLSDTDYGDLGDASPQEKKLRARIWSGAEQAKLPWGMDCIYLLEPGDGRVKATLPLSKASTDAMRAIQGKRLMYREPIASNG